MNVPFVDLGAQYFAHRAELDAAIAAVIADKAFVGMSNKYIRNFEEQFAGYSGARHCISCGNGTDALEILLKACGVGPGHEVIVPALTWIATSAAVTNVGARPVFVDIDPRTYGMDPSKIAAAITERTRAIIPVHLYGLAADMDPILALASRHGLRVIEDCAQAHGARYRGRQVGTMGVAGAFSFFPGKNLGAYGDAGGMITNDDGVAARARMISLHGQAGEKHDHRIEGRNSRMDGLQAAVLSVKLRHLEAWTEARRAIAARYDELLADADFQRQLVPADRRHVYHLYTIQVEGRDDLQRKLQEGGIETGVHYPRPLPALAAYAAYPHRVDDFPAAVRLAATTLSLPMYAEMTSDMVDHVVAALLVAVGMLSPV